MFCHVANTDFFHYIILGLIVNVNVNVADSKRIVNESLDDMESRIVGGKPVPVEHYPASAKFYNFGALCSATIINSWCVLTAAHCFDHNKEIYDMMIEVGSRFTYDISGQLHDVLTFAIHEKYNKTIAFACDVALIFLTRPVKLGAKSKKAILVNNKKWMNIKNNNIEVAGWGWTKYGGPISDKGLMATRLNYVSTRECERLHHIRLSPDMFCLYGGGAHDTCKGDSGAGVLWNDMLIGVVSHGDGCAKKDKPSVYANVWYFRRWIMSQMQTFFENVCDLTAKINRDS